VTEKPDTIGATVALLEAAIAQAMLLDPDQIEETIHDTSGPAMGGSGEPVSGGGIGDPTALAALRPIIAADNVREKWERDVVNALAAGMKPPQRPAMPRPVNDLVDIPKLHKAVEKFLMAHRIIWTACHSGTPATDWDDAVKDMHMLCELGTVADALRTGSRITSAIYSAQDAILTIQRIHDGHCAHAPDLLTRTMEAKSNCRSCARIGVDSPRTTRLLCRQCWRYVQDLTDLGEPVELQTDPNCWPSEAMLRARVEGRTADVNRHCRDWLVGHGLDPRTVLASRRGRRAS